MKSSALLIAICLLVSCDITEKAPPPKGLKSPDLPTAIHSRKIEDKESHYIEIVISDDKSELFRQGKRITTTSNSEELLSALNKARKENEMMGYASSILIGAPASTPFHVILDRIRTAAETGIHQILFLVRSNQTSEPRVVFMDTLMGGAQLPKIMPFFLQITSDGHIYSGNGPNRIQMDSGNQDQQLDKLSEQLEQFSSAAKAAGDPYAPCQIYVHPQTHYQRFIDLISLINKYELRPYFTNLLEEPKTEPLNEPKKKPSSPSSAIKPLGPAPKE